MGLQAGAVLPSRPLSTEAPQRVLVGDPDPLERSRVCASLRDQGILAQTAGTTEEILAATGVDTVLVSLAGAGAERLALIRELSGLGPHRPAIVAMSGPGETLLSEALDAGADDCGWSASAGGSRPSR